MGLRRLGHAVSLEHVAALRQGCADGIKTADAVLDEKFGGTEKANSKPYPTLRDDFCAHKLDVAIVTAVNGAALLNKHIATHCPTGGTPLDNWRRSMNEVGKRARESCLRILDRMMRMRMRSLQNSSQLLCVPCVALTRMKFAGSTFPVPPWKSPRWRTTCDGR